MATSVTTTHIFGTKDVALAGTEAQLDTTAHRLKSLLIIAHDDNVGRVFYGGSDVASTTQKGLAPGAYVSIEHSRYIVLSEFYIDATNSNDGVDFVGERI